MQQYRMKTGYMIDIETSSLLAYLCIKHKIFTMCVFYACTLYAKSVNVYAYIIIITTRHYCCRPSKMKKTTP